MWSLRSLRRLFGGCRLQLVVELTQSGAAGLDCAAILGLGHDRDRLEHSYRLQCPAVHRSDCELLARRELTGKTRVPPPVRKAGRPRRVITWPGQEHLFDRHGYAPGIYDIDEQLEAAVLSTLEPDDDVPANSRKAPSQPQVEHADHRANDGRHQGDRFDAGHAAESIREGR